MSRPVKSTTKSPASGRKKPDTRTSLLDAAEHAVRSRGVDGFSYGDLSAEIGIRKASIHYHFPAKADLLTQLMQRYSEQVVRALSDLSGNAGEQLTGFINIYREALGEGTTLCLCLSMSMGMQGLNDETQLEITRFREMAQEWLQHRFTEARTDGSIRDVAEPEQEAAAVLALAEGAQTAARFARDVAAFDQAVALFKTRLPASA